MSNWFRPAPAPTPPGPQVRAELVFAHNLRRRTPLVENQQLHQAAQNHATQMARLGRLSHIGPGGSTVRSRAAQAGYIGQMLGENIAFGQRTVSEVMASWMGSPGHRRNIEADFRDIGVGIAFDANGRIYWCVVFGRR